MAALFRRSAAICQCQRTFSTSSTRAVSLQWDKNDSEALAEALPPYPYGPARWYKQSAKGLYGGQRIQFGNNVSGDFDAKTRRKWKPNIFTRKLFSKALNRPVQVRVSSRVLRTIDKLGGLDEYLLGEKEMRIKALGESGWWLRWAIMQTPRVKNRFAEERKALGLSEEVEDFEAEAEEFEELDTEAVAMDGAFEIEHDPDLPPIKFRVGPRQHVMLTANGWVRTRPGPERRQNMAKEKIQKAQFSNYVEKRMEVWQRELQKQQLELSAAEGEGVLNAEEETELKRAAKRAFMAEMNEKIDEAYAQQVINREERLKKTKATRDAQMEAVAEEPENVNIYSSMA